MNRTVLVWTKSRGLTWAAPLSRRRGAAAAARPTRVLPFCNNTPPSAVLPSAALSLLAMFYFCFNALGSSVIRLNLSLYKIPALISTTLQCRLLIIDPVKKNIAKKKTNESAHDARRWRQRMVEQLFTSSTFSSLPGKEILFILHNYIKIISFIFLPSLYYS